MIKRNRKSPKKSSAKEAIHNLLLHQSDKIVFTSQTAIRNYLLDNNLAKNTSARCIDYAIKELLSEGIIEKDHDTKIFMLSSATTQSSAGKLLERTPLTVIPSDDIQCYIDTGKNNPAAALIAQYLSSQFDYNDLRFYPLSDCLILCLSLPETLEFPKNNPIHTRIEEKIMSRHLTLGYIDYPSEQEVETIRNNKNATLFASFAESEKSQQTIYHGKINKNSIRRPKKLKKNNTEE